MPVKRLNFTNRSKLTREQANILVHPGSPASFDAKLDLSHLPDSAGSARVFVEAYRGTSRMRFDFGTVGLPKVPPAAQRLLTEFDDWKNVLFRVKVTEAGETPGRILAWANKIKPAGPDDGKQSDLVRWKDEELNGLLWDVDFSDGEGPVVRVDKSIGYAAAGQDGRFIAAVYPEVLRQSLEQALLRDLTSHDDEEHWFFAWHKGYLTTRLKLDPMNHAPDDVDGRRAWIDDAVRAFGREFRVVENWHAAFAKGDGQ